MGSLCRASVLLVAALVARPAAAGDAVDAVDAALDRARAALVGKLESIASWAEEKQVGAFRHRVYRTILTLAPDNPRARAGLKYKRAGKNAPWVQAPDYRAPQDWNPGAVAEGEGRLAAAFETYRDAVLFVVASAAVPDARRREATERLIDLVPGDAPLRRGRGDVEHEGRWVLPETVTGAARRAKLANAARRAVREALAEIEPDRDPAARTWDVALRTPNRRALGSVSADDVRVSLALMAGADVACIQGIGSKASPAKPHLVYLLASRAEAHEFVEANPAFAGVAKEIDLYASLHLPNGALLCYRADERTRRTSGARSVVASHVHATFEGATRPWVSEGVGQRLTWYAADDHGPAFAHLSATDTKTADDEEGETPLPEDAAEWLAAAAAAMDRGPAALAPVFTVRLNAMRSSHVLVAYGLAAYLLEARPESLKAFVDAAQASDDGAAVVREVFEVDLDTLAWRLRRWLREASGLDVPPASPR